MARVWNSNTINRHGVMIPMENRLTKNDGKVPKRVWLAALWSWAKLLPGFGGMYLLTFFPMGILVALTARPAVNYLHERAARHDPDYVAQGSSGWWEYWASPYSWLDPWNNLEDGTLRESSGKGSARCGGNERSWWNQYLWTCRNAFNKGKRTSKKYACMVNDCAIEYWGSFSLSDKGPVMSGWHFVVATHLGTGHKYYGYRRIIELEGGKINQTTLGFKIKPSHGLTMQDADDLDKAFTFRKQLGANVD